MATTAASFWMRTGLALGAVVALSSIASAQPVSLADRNSTSDFDTSSQLGQYNWIVNGTNHLYQEWFWVRAAGDNFERSIDTLNRGPLFGPFDTNPGIDPRPDTFSQSFIDPAGRYQIDASFQLRGDGPNTVSDLLETFTIRNLSGGNLPMSFFQYADFDLNGSPGGDTVTILGGNRPHQTEGPFVVEETAVTPVPTHYQADFYPNTLGLLNDGAITVLNDNAGPLGPGDVTWALQWDFTLGPGGEFQISKDKQLTPAPGAIGLLGLAGLTAARRRRR